MKQTESTVVHGLNGMEPQIASTAWLAPFSVCVGDVWVGEECTLWYHAVLRGDVGSIRLGKRVNIQDHAMVHSTYQKSNVLLGDDVSVGHRAIIHGCEVGDGSLIGMGAIVMDQAVVEPNALVAAGAVVLEGAVVPSGTIWAGVPARQVKVMDPALLGERTRLTASAYVKYGGWYQNLPQMPDV